MKQKFVILVLSLVIYNIQADLSAESPFPKTKYTQALNAAMQVWSTIELLHESPLQEEDQCLTRDLLTGRLVHLSDSIRQIKKEKIKKLEDLSYLYDLIAEMKAKVTELPTNRSELKNCSLFWLNKINTRLEKILQE